MQLSSRKPFILKAGSSCEIDELAAWMGQSATGGTFRTRLGAARMFGLTENSPGPHNADLTWSRCT